jgi:hypothetical protein
MARLGPTSRILSFIHIRTSRFYLSDSAILLWTHRLTRCVIAHVAGLSQTCTRTHRRNLGGGKGKMPLQYFIYLRIFFGYWVEEGQIKNWGEGVVCLLRTGSKFLIFLTWLLRKLKFLMPLVDFAPPTPASLCLNSCCAVENGRRMHLCLYYPVEPVHFITSWVLDQDLLLPLPKWLPVCMLYLNMCFTMFSVTWHVQRADLPSSKSHTNFRSTMLFQTSCYQTFSLEDHAFRLSASTHLAYSLLSIGALALRRPLDFAIWFSRGLILSEL